MIQGYNTWQGGMTRRQDEETIQGEEVRCEDITR